MAGGLSFRTATKGICIPGSKPVKLIDRKTAAAQSISSATKFKVKTTEIDDSDGRYKQGDVKWKFDSDLVAADPKLGDVIREDDTGFEFITVGVDLTHLDEVYRVFTRRPQLDVELDEIVDIKVRNETRGSGGMPSVTLDAFASGVNAHVQEQIGDEQIDASRRRLEVTHIVFFDKDFDLGVNHRIVKGSLVLRVIKTRDLGALDRFFTVETREELM